MNKERAYSLLTVKAVNEENRIIKGIATTPEPDRVGDVVEPDGVVFKNPAPLLWMHKHDLPVGTVTFGKPTKDGVPFEARLPSVLEPSQLKARIDEAWQSIKAGLVRAVSIGFRPLEYSIIDDTGGYRFTKSEIYELSLVTVPANPGASITEIKSFDAQILAAAGRLDKAANGLNPSGVTEKTKTIVKIMPKKEGKSMKLNDQIKSFQAERTAKVAKMEEIMEKSAENGETLTEEQEQEFETLKDEIATIDKHLDRLDTLKKATESPLKALGATPVKGDNENNAAQSRSSIIKVAPRVDAGISLARLARCKALSRLDNMPAYEIAKQLYPEDRRIENILKAAVAAGTTNQTTWAAPLVGDESSVFADFVEYLRPMTILGKFGAAGVPGLRRIPFRTRLISQTTGGEGYWVGEGSPKPVTKFDFAGTTLEPLKVANIAVVTMELLRDSSPSAEAILRDQLAEALRARLDTDFVDPDKSAVANVSPASITNGVSAVASSGTDADAVREDIKTLFNTFIADNNAPTNGVWIMPATTALALSLMQNPLGQSEFPGISMNGGTLFGLPVIVSEYVTTNSNGAYVLLVNASDIWLGDDGGIQIDMSDQASLQMDTAPTNNSYTPTATQLVSLWQSNSVGFRAERTINWAKRRTGAVAVLNNVNWGAAA